MKKVLSVLIVAILSITLVACGSKEIKEENKETDKPKQEQTKKESIKMPDKEMGKGSITLSTQSGDSKNGNIPFIYSNGESKDDIIQIGIASDNFDGSKLSYIFIDGTLTSKEQLSEVSNGSLNITGENLKIGKHKVEVVQFDNDKIDGKIITYKIASYECKKK